MKNTTENNKLIAEFMQWEKLQDETYKSTDFFHLEGEGYSTYMDYVWDVKDMEFNEDWNWLMSVIKEIGDRTDFELVMGYGHCYWNNAGEQPLGDFDGGYGDIIYIYTAVVEFIKWHNLNK